MAKVTYDAAADVLYVNYADGPADRGVETDGIVRRYSLDSQLHGVTILDFAERLRNRAIDLAK